MCERELGMYVCRIRRVVSRGSGADERQRKNCWKIPMCRIVTGWYCMFVSIFCVRLSVIEQDCSFVCLNSVSPYQSYSPSPSLVRFLTLRLPD